MQLRNERRLIDLPRTACTVAEADDVGTVLLQARFKHDTFRPVREGNEPSSAVDIVANENRQLAPGVKYVGRVSECQCETFQEFVEGRGA